MCSRSVRVLYEKKRPRVTGEVILLSHNLRKYSDCNLLRTNESQTVDGVRDPTLTIGGLHFGPGTRRDPWRSSNDSECGRSDVNGRDPRRGPRVGERLTVVDGRGTGSECRKVREGPRPPRSFAYSRSRN